MASYAVIQSLAGSAAAVAPATLIQESNRSRDPAIRLLVVVRKTTLSNVPSSPFLQFAYADS